MEEGKPVEQGPFVLGVASFFVMGMIERERQPHTDTQIHEEGVRKSRAAISLQPMARWQAESVQSSEITGGETFCLQPMEDSTLEQVFDPEKDCD